MQHVRIGSEVVRNAETMVVSSHGPRSDEAAMTKFDSEPIAPSASQRDRASDIAINVAFALAVVVLLAWANGRFSPAVALVLVTAIGAGLAYWLIARWNRIFEAQRLELDASRSEQAKLSALTTELRSQVDLAHRRGAEITERSLKRIGADLHDGPAQLLGLVLLKLDELNAHIGSASDDSKRARDTVDLIRRATAEALEEIRNTARGLVLPDIEQVSLAAALELAVRSHERRTRTSVVCEIGLLPPHVPLATTISLFRFAQEGLNNAFRHAGGRGQSLKADYTGSEIVIEVSDRGLGFDPTRLENRKDKLGLAGLRQRLESLGGTFEITTVPGTGTRLVARFRHPSS